MSTLSPDRRYRQKLAAALILFAACTGAAAESLWTAPQPAVLPLSGRIHADTNGRGFVIRDDYGGHVAVTEIAVLGMDGFRYELQSATATGSHCAESLPALFVGAVQADPPTIVPSLQLLGIGSKDLVERLQIVRYSNQVYAVYRSSGGYRILSNGSPIGEIATVGEFVQRQQCFSGTFFPNRLIAVEVVADSLQLRTFNTFDPIGMIR